MTLTERLSELIRAAFSGIYIQTHEPDDALAEIVALCRDHAWRLAVWDIEAGLTVPGTARDGATSPSAAAGDPLAAVRAAGSLGAADVPSLLVLRGFQRFLGSPEIVRAVERRLHAGKVQQTFLVILAPTVQLPVELERLFTVVEHELPSREQLAAVARGVATDAEDVADAADFERVVDAAAGLTRYEAEGAFALSLVRHGRLRPEVVWDLKAQALTKNGLLGLHRGSEAFDGLGGLAALKTFCKRSLLRPGRPDPLRRPRGVLLLGVSGTGKSAFAKALGAETGRPTLLLDIGALFGSLVGQTEQNVRQALKIADAAAPCVLFVDEIDKALAGTATSGQTDSGVGARLFGTLLTWLNDRTSDVYLVATANDIARLPPEFARAERFDGVFFLDLPGRDERDAVWRLYLRVFELDADQPLPADEGWTGAEIRACCRLAAVLDLPLAEAARQIVPVAVTAAESVERLRSWAEGRCLDAQQPGIYRRQAAVPGETRRRVRRDPSPN